MKRLYRSKCQRVLGGVSGGFAEYFETDVVLVRLAWVVFGVMTGGIGALIAYIFAWIIIPEEPDKANPSEPGGSQHVPDVTGSGQRLFGFILVGVGALMFLNRTLPVHYRVLFAHSLNRLWPLLIVALGVAIIVKSLRRE